MTTNAIDVGWHGCQNFVLVDLDDLDAMPATDITGIRKDVVKDPWGRTVTVSASAPSVRDDA